MPGKKFLLYQRVDGYPSFESLQYVKPPDTLARVAAGFRARPYAGTGLARPGIGRNHSAFNK